MAKIAVFGYGTVGSGIVEVIKKNQELVDRRAGENVDIKYILDLRDFPGDPYENLVTHDVEQILGDTEISVIAEAMGGIEPAYTFTKKALMSGKSVCTSNKELVEKKGSELIRIAKENNVNYLFEASVGGGIPILRPLVTCITADDIDKVTGILNGTTNYILTRMSEDGSSFEDVLKDAQNMGYAERNPEADIEGYDAGRKIAIMASLITGKNVSFNDVYTEGIKGINPEDFEYARRMKRAIKLLAMYRKTSNGQFAYVAPAMIGRDNPLYAVNGVFNGILVHGNMLGDAMFYGQGAGKLPTASAVCSDIVECVKEKQNIPGRGFDEQELALTDHKSRITRFFVRVKNENTDQFNECFAECDKVSADVAGETGFVTMSMSQKDFESKAEKLSGIIKWIRVED